MELLAPAGNLNKLKIAVLYGADAIYCPQSERYIKALSDEGIPVVGHTGFIPYKSTLYGGFKAFGKNALEAKKIYDHLIFYELAMWLLSYHYYQLLQ